MKSKDNTKLNSPTKENGSKMNAIKFNNVSKIYKDGTIALDGVNVEIESGEFIFLIGSSGAGKTTLMNLIVREELPSEGSVMVLDEEVSSTKKSKMHNLRRKVGYIFQDFKLLDSKTVYENVALSLEVAGLSESHIKKVVPNLLHLVGLSDKIYKFPQSLSGGEKQRLAIARALAHEPKILLADEPTGNLDETATWVIVDLIKKINEWGTTIIFGTHNMDIVNNLKKRTIQLDKGKIIKDN